MTPPAPLLLESVLADAREELAIVARHSTTCTLAFVTALLDRIARAAEDMTTWLSEDEARMRSGKSVRWLRRQWPDWQAQGHARFGTRGNRQYRQIIVPQRVHLSVIRDDARRVARGEATA